VTGVSFDVPGEAYDRFMGRYSRPLAGQLTDWLEVSTPQRALDVGCGPGAWTGHLVERLGAPNVCAVDPSASFVAACRERHPGVEVLLGSASALPFADGSFDVTGANLVVHFMPDPVAGVAEMARVTGRGSLVGATVWDLSGGRVPMAQVWQAVAEVRPDGPGEPALPGGSREALGAILLDAGLRDVEVVEMAVTLTHPSFEEWWEPYLHVVGPVGELIGSLDDLQREEVRERCRSALGDGPFGVTAVAYAARGRV
jgi:SAM-dependent methyltransferase